MAKGQKTGGRRKGTPNKVTAQVKEAIEAAFTRAGGVEYLVGVAKEQPQVFCTLLGRVLPLQVTGDPEHPVEMRVSWASSGK